MDTTDKENLEKMREFYDSVYYKNIQSNRNVSIHYRKLASRIGIEEGQHVLDVACGAGNWLLACSELGATPHGIDLSEKAVDICRSTMPNGEFHSGPAESLPFEDNKFDSVSCLGSLEHFVNPERALKEMVRVAKDKAKFILLVPNKDFLTRRLGLYSGTNQVEAKEDVRSLEGWERLFESAGLKVDERWKDLHVLSWSWITSRRWYHVPLRTLQAVMLIAWPLTWQYQVYHLCTIQKI